MGILETLFLAHLGLWLVGHLVTELLVPRVFAAAEALVPTGTPEPVTLVKPLRGVDRFTEACLRSWLSQDYAGELQVVFSLQDPADPAHALLARLAAEPGMRAFETTVNPIEPGFHGKTSNLLHGVRRARHGILVFSDADIEAEPGTLGMLVGRLQAGYDMAGCLVVHDRAEGFWGRLYAAVWNAACDYAGGISMWAGRMPLLPGGTVAIRAGALARLGGVEAFGRFVIDDYAMSRLALAHGIRGGLGPVVRSPVGPMDAARWMEKVGRGSAGWRELPAYPLSLLLFPLGNAYLYAIPAFALAGNRAMVGAGLATLALRSLVLGRLVRLSEGRWRPFPEFLVFEAHCQLLVLRTLATSGFSWGGVEYRRGRGGALEREG